MCSCGLRLCVLCCVMRVTPPPCTRVHWLRHPSGCSEQRCWGQRVARSLYGKKISPLNHRKQIKCKLHNDIYKIKNNHAVNVWRFIFVNLTRYSRQNVYSKLTVCIKVDSELATSTNTSASRQNLSIQLSNSVVTSMPGLKKNNITFQI